MQTIFSLGDTIYGSGTCYNKNIGESIFEKSLVEYLPTIPQLPEYNVCKNSLEDLRKLTEVLSLFHVFAHSDEQVYANLAHIIWK